MMKQVFSEREASMTRIVPAILVAGAALFILSSCTPAEEGGGKTDGGICDLQGTLTCDDEGTTLLECSWNLVWQVKEYCANGCTEELGYAQCIGGGTDNWVSDYDNALPDTAEETPDAFEQELPDLFDDTTAPDDAPVITDDAVIPDEDTGTDETETEDDTVTDDAAVTDDAVVTDDATVTDDSPIITDDATAPDEDTVTDTTPDTDTVEGCGTDWTLNSTTNTCYRYFATAKNFEEAEAACVSETGHLVNIASSEENDWVRDNLGVPTDTAYWIGYTAKDATGPGTGSANGNSCSSAYVVSSSGGTYSLNTAGAPTSSSGCTCSGTVSGKFVSFRLNNPTTGYWEIAADTNGDAVITIHENPSCTSCTTNRKACVDNVIGAGREVFNNQYLLNSSKWYVIMITGKSANVTGTLYIRPPITTSNFADHYTWTDGVSHAYHNFASGQPDYANGNERCAQVAAGGTWGEWNDNQCSTALPYVCEKNP